MLHSRKPGIGPMFAAQGAFGTQKYESDSRNLISHSRTLHFALSEVWGNGSTQGVRLEGEASQRCYLEQCLLWDTLQFAAGQFSSKLPSLQRRLGQWREWLVLYLAPNTSVYVTRPHLGPFFSFILYILIYPSKYLVFKLSGF